MTKHEQAEINKHEEKEEKDEKEDVWKATSEDLEGAISAGKPIRGRVAKWFMEKGFGFA